MGLPYKEQRQKIHLYSSMKSYKKTEIDSLIFLVIMDKDENYLFSSYTLNSLSITLLRTRECLTPSQGSTKSHGLLIY